MPENLAGRERLAVSDRFGVRNRLPSNRRFVPIKG